MVEFSVGDEVMVTHDPNNDPYGWKWERGSAKTGIVHLIERGAVAVRFEGQGDDVWYVPPQWVTAVNGPW